jgi:uncharacterized protein YyaL (SSP411 family)
MTSQPRAPNRLARETSPYLLQHAANPVDWYPWGSEALERARAEHKPIFLSIGYSACHWCHVMERESFEDEAVAGLLARYFVSVKVDREERPDVDAVYMRAVQALTGSGGWPLSVFLTPELEPFFGGTYFPPVRVHGRPSFGDLVRALGEAWERERGSLVERGRQLAERIRKEASQVYAGELQPSVLDRSLAQLSQSYDDEWGGFGGPPKFPHALDLRICLRHRARTHNPLALAMARHTLERMALGGVNDQLGGGFHRYSTDEKWLVPHFEKMLYDNALLVPAYVEGWLAVKEPLFARAARECCQWVLREMVTPEGGFCSAQDADSEGAEGRFYVWTSSELQSVLGRERAGWAAAWWDVSDEGNFEDGASVLWRAREAAQVARELRIEPGALAAAMEDARKALFAARERRVRPATDDKLLVGWNGLMISALAQAWQALRDEAFLPAASRAARWILTHMGQPDGRLFATARAGRSQIDAGLDDYAFLIQGLIDLYESDFDARWIEAALALAEVVERELSDGERGGWFTTASSAQPLIARLKSTHDGALPAGAGVHVLNLLRLAELTGQGSLAQAAQAGILSLGALVDRHPAAFSQLLLAVDFLAAGPREIVVAGALGSSAAEALLETVRSRFLPHKVVARAHPEADADLMPLLDGKTAPSGEARAYVCRNWSCDAPVATPAELESALAD